HRSHPFAEQRRIRLPVRLLFLEAAGRERAVAIGTERKGTALPAVDQIGAVRTRLSRRGDVQFADLPSSGRTPLVGRRGDRHAVAREPVRRLTRDAVRPELRRRATHGPGEVRTVPGVARTELLGIAGREAVAVDPLI